MTQKHKSRKLAPNRSPIKIKIGKGTISVSLKGKPLNVDTGYGFIASEAELEAIAIDNSNGHVPFLIEDQNERGPASIIGAKLKVIAHPPDHAECVLDFTETLNDINIDRLENIRKRVIEMNIPKLSKVDFALNHVDDYVTLKVVLTVGGTSFGVVINRMKKLVRDIRAAQK